VEPEQQKRGKLTCAGMVVLTTRRLMEASCIINSTAAAGVEAELLRCSETLCSRASIG